MTGTDVTTYTRERPGMSAFVLEDGAVYHTYSTYARGLDVLWQVTSGSTALPMDATKWILVSPPLRVRQALSEIVDCGGSHSPGGYQKIKHHSNILRVINFTKNISILPEIILGDRK